MSYTYIEAKSLVDKYKETIVGMPMPDKNNVPLVFVKHLVVVPKDILMPIINLYLENGFDNEKAINEYQTEYNMDAFKDFDVYVVGMNEHLILRDELEKFIKEFL